MRFRLTTALMAGLLTLSGCVVLSLNPIYTDRDLVYWPELEGTWVFASDSDHRQSYCFERGDDAKEYRVIMRNGDESCVLSVHLTQIGKYTFLDATLGKSNPDHLEFAFMRPVHYFCKIELNGDTLRMGEMDSNWVKQRHDKKRLSIAHETDESTLLTANTKRVRRFLARWANDSDAFEDWTEMKRKSQDGAASPKSP